MTLAPVKAVVRVVVSLRSAWTISTPLVLNEIALGLEASRVIPRMLQPGRERKVLATEPPWIFVVSYVELVREKRQYLSSCNPEDYYDLVRHCDECV